MNVDSFKCVNSIKLIFSTLNQVKKLQIAGKKKKKESLGSIHKKFCITHLNILVLHTVSCL